MHRIKIFPLQSWLIAFLATRQLDIVDEDPTILHYFGNNKHEILKLKEIDGFDLIVLHMKIDTHTKTSSQFLNQFKVWIIDPSNSIKEMQRSDNPIWTNNVQLAQIYYQRLGIQRKIIELDLTPEVKEPIKFSLGNFKDSFKSSFKYFCRFMSWQ